MPIERLGLGQLLAVEQVPVLFLIVVRVWTVLGLDADNEPSTAKTGLSVLVVPGLPGTVWEQVHKRCGQEDAIPLGWHRNVHENTLGTLFCNGMP